MALPTITGLQAIYIEDGGFDIVKDARLSRAKNDNSYMETQNGNYIHLGTAYEHFFNGKNGDEMLSTYLFPQKKPKKCKPRRKPRQPVQNDTIDNNIVKLEIDVLKKDIKEFIKANPTSNMDDLIAYLKRLYNRTDLSNYMNIIRQCKNNSVQFLTWIEELDPEYGGSFRMAFKTPSGMRYVCGDYAAGILEIKDMSNIPSAFHNKIRAIVGEKISEHMKEYTSD